MNVEEPSQAKIVPEAWGLGSGAPGATAARGGRSVRLENPLVRARVLLDQGGMLAEFEDRTPGAGTGQVDCAVRIHCGSRENAPLSIPMDHQVLEAEDEHDPAVIVLHSLVPGEPCSVQAAYVVHPDSPALSIEVSVQNRSLHPLFIPSGLRFELEVAEVLGMLEEGLVAISTANGNALILQSPPHTWDELRIEGSELVLLSQSEPFPPLGKHSWACKLWPLADVGKLWAFGKDAIVGVRPDRVLVARVREPMPSGKVVLRLASGEPVEAATDLSPSSPFMADLTSQGLNPTEAAVLDSSKRVRAQRGPHSPPLLPGAREPRQMPDGLDEYLGGLDHFCRGQDPTELWRPSRSAFFGAASLALLAVHASLSGDHEAANERIEEALNRAGDHELYWWLKAAMARSSGKEVEGAIPYAHSLSPMEPLLRVEGFLGQNPHSPVESELLRPLAENPDAAHDVVAMLFTLGMHQEAARVADELLRHGELPLVRIMLAWSLLKTTRHEAEAAQHLARVESQPVEPPYPYRPYEVESVLGLAEWAPLSVRLRGWAALVEG